MMGRRSGKYGDEKLLNFTLADTMSKTSSAMLKHAIRLILQDSTCAVVPTHSGRCKAPDYELVILGLLHDST